MDAWRKKFNKRMSVDKTARKKSRSVFRRFFLQLLIASVLLLDIDLIQRGAQAFLKLVDIPAAEALLLLLLAFVLVLILRKRARAARREYRYMMEDED